ncbi:hypothetical protein RhiirA4_491250, partial [Rhizophagus irregularis]
MEKAIAAPVTSLHDLQFHEHDPSAKKADEQLRTLVVTDIPLFVTDAQLRALSPVMVLLPTAERVSQNFIALQISAKSVNIPFSYNSYNPKPYAYVHFSSAANKESAMGISCALKNIGLTWHEPTDVSSLCYRCGHPGCNMAPEYEQFLHSELRLRNCQS